MEKNQKNIFSWATLQPGVNMMYLWRRSPLRQDRRLVPHAAQPAGLCRAAARRAAARRAARAAARRAARAARGGTAARRAARAARGTAGLGPNCPCGKTEIGQNSSAAEKKKMCFLFTPALFR